MSKDVAPDTDDSLGGEWQIQHVTDIINSEPRMWHLYFGRSSQVARTDIGMESDFSRTDGRLPPEFDQTPLDFVCEEDVRRAIQGGRKLIVSERAIVTPAARDLGEQYRIFTVTPWRG